MTSASLRAFRLLVAGLLCTAALVACGSSEEDGAAAQTLIARTFGESATAIERGKVDARLQLEPEGLLAIGGPIILDVSGPFSSGGAGSPKLDLAFVATLAGEHYKGAIISTGKKGFLRLDNRTYSLDGAFGSSKAHRDSGKSKKSGLKDSLGIDPSTWISNPQSKGSETVSGVETERIGADVNVSKLLADIAGLLDRAGGSSSKGGGGFLTAKLRKQIAGAVKSAKVDVWTGAQDKILRQIAVAIQFEFPAGEQPPIAGLEAGKINFKLRLDDVNGAAVTVAEPKNTRPLSDVTGGGLAAFLSGVGASLTGTGKDGAGTQEFLGCVTQAGGKTAEIVRCASKLAP